MIEESIYKIVILSITFLLATLTANDDHKNQAISISNKQA